MNQTEEMEHIRAVLNGATDRYAYFLHEYSGQVFVLISKIVSDREVAEELTQDVFLKAFNKLSSFNGNSKFSSWLYRIAYNSAISFVRKKKIVFPSFDEAIINSVPDDAVDALLDKVEDEVLLSKLESAIEKLGTEEKAIITLFYIDDKPLTEVAEIMGLSLTNTKVKLHRIRKKLFVLIKEEGYETR